MAGIPEFSTGKGRRVAGWFFVVIAAVLLLIAVLAAISPGGGDAGSVAVGIGVIVVAAAGSALAGRHLLRERSGAPAHRRTAAVVTAWVCYAVSALLGVGTVALVITWAVKGLSDPIGLVYTFSSSVAVGQFGRILLAKSRRNGTLAVADAPGPSAGRRRRACTLAQAVAAIEASRTPVAVELHPGLKDPRRPAA